MYHIFFIHSSVDGLSGCIHVPATTSNVAVNTEVHVSFWNLTFWGFIPSSGIAGSYGSFIFTYLRSLHPVLHSCFINLYSDHQCKRVPRVFILVYFVLGFLGDSVVKNLPANAGDMCLIPWSALSPGEGNGNPFQYSCLENPLDRGTWKLTVLGVVRVGLDLVTKQQQHFVLHEYYYSSFLLISICMEYLFPSPSVLFWQFYRFAFFALYFKFIYRYIRRLIVIPFCGQF